MSIELIGAKVKGEIYKIAGYCADCGIIVYSPVMPDKSDTLRCTGCGIKNVKMLALKGGITDRVEFLLSILEAMKRAGM